MKLIFSVLLSTVLGSISSAGSEKTSPLTLILYKGEYVLPVFLDPRKTNPPTFLGYYGLAINQKMVKFCPPISKKQKETVEEDLNKYQSCLFPVERNQLTACNEEINSIVIKKLDDGSNHIECGEAGTNSKMYQFGYHLCFWKNPQYDLDSDQSNDEIEEQFLAIYDFCYDHDSKGTTYIQHKIYSPALLKEKLLENEQKFITDLQTNDFGLFNDDFKKMKGSCSIMMNLILHDENTTYLKDVEVVEQLLASPNYMAFALWRKPFFHYINVQILWKELAKTWNEIDSYVIDIAQKYLGSITVISGVLYKHKGNQAEQERYINTPKILWKLVYSALENYAIAIIMHNRTKYDPSPKPLCQSICAENGLKNLVPPGMENLVYCCLPEIITQKMQLPIVRPLNMNDFNENYTSFYHLQQTGVSELLSNDEVTE